MFYFTCDRSLINIVGVHERLDELHVMSIDVTNVRKDIKTTLKRIFIQKYILKV